ncbi:V-SNARE coiled-coil homology domain-containing protein [Plasmodiophora brassicae]|nr:hypothetical protein PBRA_001582 [Plasmodiophora brassicae]
MDIIFALIARGTKVLAECTKENHKGNFSDVGQRILRRVKWPGREPGAAGSRRMTFTNQSFSFHILAREGIAFMCMTKSQTGRHLPFDFLDQVSKHYFKEYGGGAGGEGSCHLPSMLRRCMKTLAMSDEFMRIDSMNRELDDVAETMRLNIESVVDRGEKISLLVEKTDSLSMSSRLFRRQSRLVWFRSLLRRYKTRILMAVVVLVLLGLFYAYISAL